MAFQLPEQTIEDGDDQHIPTKLRSTGDSGSPKRGRELDIKAMTYLVMAREYCVSPDNCALIPRLICKLLALWHRHMRKSLHGADQPDAG
ncbi:MULTISPECIES: hypothetical protein [Mesorhizobium]|uniref:hypothetical protein n=1 Tax=Mesorhizobium TaxID=68287 RepID=UPI00049ABB79|nr:MULTISPECIES: hypothetical protein [Mesorhizobium]